MERVTPENGCLCVVPGSHKAGTLLPHEYPSWCVPRARACVCVRAYVCGGMCARACVRVSVNIYNVRAGCVRACFFLCGVVRDVHLASGMVR